MLTLGKVGFYALWVLVIAFLCIAYLYNPAIVEPAYLRHLIQSNGNEMMLLYIAITFVRGFFLIPSTPFVIAGSLLFPDKLAWVLIISMTGVMFSATLLYYFSDMLGFSKYLEKKHPKHIEKWKERITSPKATWIVLGWSVFPLVPTDLICYVAGIVKMPYKYMFFGVFFGELILDVFYIYFASNT